MNNQEEVNKNIDEAYEEFQKEKFEDSEKETCLNDNLKTSSEQSESEKELIDKEKRNGFLKHMKEEMQKVKEHINLLNSSIIILEDENKSHEDAVGEALILNIKRMIKNSPEKAAEILLKALSTKKK